MKPFLFLRPALTLLLLISCIISVPAQLNQRGTSTTNNYQVLRINNNLLRISNLNYTDQLNPGGDMTHTVSFNFNFSGDEPARAALFNLLAKQPSKMISKDGPALSILTISPSFEILEQRDYSVLSIQELILPQLDASQRDVLKASVKITAANMNLIAKAGTQAVAGTKNIIGYVNNFSLSLGALPCKRISMISSLNLKNAVSGATDFSVMVSGTDAQVWNQAFLNGTANNLQGAINILAPDLKGVLNTLTIANARITSFSMNSTTGKATVGIQANRINVERIQY